MHFIRRIKPSVVVRDIPEERKCAFWRVERNDRRRGRFRKAYVMYSISVICNSR